MSQESTQIVPPFFGPEWPIYPVHTEFVRVFGSPDSAMVYQAFVLKISSAAAPTLRDREQCYVKGANGETLKPGNYIGRLETAYTGVNGQLPIFFVNCCP